MVRVKVKARERKRARVRTARFFVDIAAQDLNPSIDFFAAVGGSALQGNLGVCEVGIEFVGVLRNKPQHSCLRVGLV